MCVPPIGYSSDPKACSVNTDCATNSSSVIGEAVYGECACGYNKVGQGYCTPFSGNSWFQKAFAQFQGFLSSGLWGNCNQAGNALECAMTYWDNSNSVKLAYYYFMGISGMYVDGADSCTVAMLFPQYYTFETEYDKLSSATLGIVSVLISLVI